MTRPGFGQQSINLPPHDSRHVPASDGLIAGPSAKQIERDARDPPPQQDFPHHQPLIFLQSIPPPLPQVYHPHPHQTRRSETPMTIIQKTSRPQPIYIPASEKGRANNPFTSFGGTSTSSQDVARSLLRAQKELSNSSKNHSEAGLPAVQNHTAEGAQRSNSWSTYAVSKSSYLSISFANGRRTGAKWPQDPGYTQSPPDYPANHYISPDCIPNATFVASRKRNRGLASSTSTGLHLYTL